MTGILYVVATPLGNLEDISFRAINTLKIVDVIAAEDTRHSKKLLSHFNINKPMVSINEQNERIATKSLLIRLQQGQSIALISDAGTPLVSDPGYFVVRQAREANIPVVPIPGACAAIAALSIAGLPSDHFVFEGFLPAKRAQRLHRLAKLSNEDRTLIFYESPHRILETLHDMCTALGCDRRTVVARELTKLHETLYDNTLKELFSHFEHHPDQIRGEFVILIQGAQKQEQETIDLSIEAILKPLMTALPHSKAVELTAEITKVRKNKIYQLALTLK